jgi:hypothetical protein
VRILDGSHLRATERRLDVQRMINGAPPPGQALVVLSPQRMLIEDMSPCECGHRQERLILQQLIEVLEPGIVWSADRNFCTSLWLREVDLNKSWFIVRRHAALPIEPASELCQMSANYVADEISSVSSGMQIVLPQTYWRQEFGQLPADTLAERLKRMAEKVDMRKYRKPPRGPKKPKPNAPVPISTSVLKSY